MLFKASKNNPEVQKQIAGKDSMFSLVTLDGKVARSFIIRDGKISSHAGRVDNPVFSMGFKDAAFGYEVMTAKNKQLAFMQGIQNKDIKIEGDTAQVIWFQGLMKYAMPRKKKKPEAK